MDIAAANVLDIAAEIDPTKVVGKIKYHLLPHLRADILWFGLLVGVATETFECYNAIFRFCSIFSNHLTPSRNIALQLAEQESIKHCISGGWWLGPNGEWEQPGPSARQFLASNPMLQALYGWSNTKVATPGRPSLIVVDDLNVTHKLVRHGQTRTTQAQRK